MNYDFQSEGFLSSGPPTVSFRPVVSMASSRPDMEFTSFSSGGLASSPQLISPTQTSPLHQGPPVQVTSFQPIRPMQQAIFAQTPVFSPDIYRYED